MREVTVAAEVGCLGEDDVQGFVVEGLRRVGVLHDDDLAVKSALDVAVEGAYNVFRQIFVVGWLLPIRVGWAVGD